ncbi:hypothetical protein CJU75_23115 [Pseudomonas fragi]|uniref:Relaxase/mobilization nuclease domain-containing protein n=6 Tax=Pseudomonas TaxID=286 RepID=A0A6A7Z4Y4_9PSED|nr:relaxase/mobilization nuclease domain-containing protein [Pseudomonas helleri]PAA08769.1 hypothetical protein CJU74_23970 [Pseudomonas fragi]PAA30054.1 hypothetical protein CJU75_23115 [Pseudomonas fragi]
MIVKFHARGTGGGKGPTQYLLGRDGQREGATLLRGDPEQVAELIDSSRYAKKYTSGVLSFAEADLPPEQKRALMDSFEKALLPGLEARQYSCLWVEHQDKGRLELNFVIPNLELTEGKRLQPYYHVADQRRVDAWATVQRAELGLSDPKDPARRRALVTPRDLPPERQQVAQQITDGLLALAAQGEVRSRADVLEKLTGAGFQVARETKSSISIADPDGGKNIRLKGALYERDFRLGPELRGEIEAASQRYRDGRDERLQTARTDLARGIEIKRTELERRHPGPREEPQRAFERDRGQHQGVSPIGLEMARREPAGGHPGRERGPVVDRADGGGEFPDHRAAEGHDGPRPGAGDGVLQRRKRRVPPAAQREEGVQRVEFQGTWPRGREVGEVGYDGDREGLARRLGEFTERARAAAEQFRRDLAKYADRAREGLEAVGRSCRDLAGAVRAQPDREHGPVAAGAELERTSERLGAARRGFEPRAQEVIQEHQRHKSRRGPTLG